MPEAPAEEDRGEMQSLADADQVRGVLAQGWSRTDAHNAAAVSENGATRISRWQQQVCLSSCVPIAYVYWVPISTGTVSTYVCAPD